MREFVRQGINENEYKSIHIWLKYHYGKPDHCEWCDGEKAKRFEYALKHGKKYEKDINNYIQLCKSCHFWYDYHPENSKKPDGFGQKISGILKGRKQDPEITKRIAKKNTGQKRNLQTRNRISEGLKKFYNEKD